MNVKNWLKKVSFIKTYEISGCDPLKAYCSNYDHSFLTFVGLEKSLKLLAKYEITKFLTHGLGYSSKTNKWYGWSHRGICGFTIGSKCKKGDIHYTKNRKEWVAKTMNDAKQMAIDFRNGCS